MTKILCLMYFGAVKRLNCINWLLLALNLAKMNHICHFVLYLPIELKPSLVPLVPLTYLFATLDIYTLYKNKESLLVYYQPSGKEITRSPPVSPKKRQREGSKNGTEIQKGVPHRFLGTVNNFWLEQLFNEKHWSRRRGQISSLPVHWGLCQKFGKHSL